MCYIVYVFLIPVLVKSWDNIEPTLLSEHSKTNNIFVLAAILSLVNQKLFDVLKYKLRPSCRNGGDTDHPKTTHLKQEVAKPDSKR